MLRIGIKWMGAVGLIVLCSGSATAQRNQAQAAEAYIDTLKDLQQTRVRLFQNAFMLVQADQQLRASIYQKELTANARAQVAMATPDVSLSQTTISKPKSTSSSESSGSWESSSSSKDEKQTVMIHVDNTGFKNAMANEAYFWRLQSLFDQSQLQQTHAVFHGVMTQLVANLVGFCNLADTYGWRSQVESEQAAELTESWLKEDPANVGAMLVRAAALRNLGQLEISQRLATEVQKYPSVARPLAATLIAQCQILEGNNAEAHRQLAAAIKVARGSAIENPLVIRAMLHAAEGNFIKAMDDAKKAVACDKTAAYALCIQCLLECESDEKHTKLRLAKEHAIQAAKISTDRSWQTREILARVNAKTGDFAAAEKFMQDAVDRAHGERKRKLEQSLAKYQQQTLPPFTWEDFLKASWATVH